MARNAWQVICCNEENILVGPRLDQLRRITKATGAKVVLSTNWRRYAAFKRRLLRTLQRARIGCVGSTPLLDEHLPVRPQEIVRWLRRHGAGVDGWVVLDDRDLLSEMGGAKLTNCFVKTCPRAGLTASAADEAIRILGGNVDRAKPTHSVTAASPLATATATATATTTATATVKVRSKSRACRPPKTPPFWSASPLSGGASVALPSESLLPSALGRRDGQSRPARASGSMLSKTPSKTPRAVGLSVLPQ